MSVLHEINRMHFRWVSRQLEPLHAAAAAISLCLLSRGFVQNLNVTNLNITHHWERNKKNKGSILMSIFKVGITEVPLFFQILYLLLPKIEICRRYFLAKNSPKQPFWHCRGKENWRSPVQLWSLFFTMAVFWKFLSRKYLKQI